MSTDAATKRPPRSYSHLHLGSQSAASGVSHAARSDLSSALAAAFSDLPSALSAALVVLALFSEVSSAALVFESEFVTVTAPTLARTPAVPSVNDAPAPTKRKRTFDIQISSRNETPSSVGKKNQADAANTQIEIGASVPVRITLTRGPLVVLLTRALIRWAAVS